MSTLSVSVIGHTYSLMTTFVPSIQRGNGSRGSLGNLAARRRGVVEKLDGHDITKRMTKRWRSGRRERDKNKCVGRGSSHPSFYRRGWQPRIWRAFGCPHLSPNHVSGVFTQPTHSLI